MPFQHAVEVAAKIIAQEANDLKNSTGFNPRMVVWYQASTLSCGVIRLTEYVASFTSSHSGSPCIPGAPFQPTAESLAAGHASSAVCCTANCYRHGSGKTKSSNSFPPPKNSSVRNGVPIAQMGNVTVQN